MQVWFAVQVPPPSPQLAFVRHATHRALAV
jgi:hypothetical protein